MYMILRIMGRLTALMLVVICMYVIVCRIGVVAYNGKQLREKKEQTTEWVSSVFVVCHCMLCTV